MPELTDEGTGTVTDGRVGSSTGSHRRRSRSRMLSRLSNALLVVLPLVALIGFWHVATTVWLDAPRIYAPPMAVLEEIVNLLSGQSAVVGTSYEHAIATFRRFAAAFVIAMVLGTLVGVAAGRVRLLFDLIDSTLWVFMAIPSIVWAFIFVVTLGITEAVPVLALLGIIGPIVTLQVAEGTKAIPKNLIDLADSYKIFGRDRFFHLFLPYLVPYLAGSARVAFALCIRIIVVAEVVGLSRGIGFEMSFWYQTLVLAPLVAWSVLLATFGLIVDHTVFKPIERRVTRWREGASGAVEDPAAQVA